MKKIINKADDLVIEMCDGMVKAHPRQLVFNRKFKVLSRAQANKQKVSLISGGGSGHEPAHGGFVGTGMLDAAVCGDVFASPSTIQVYNAILQTQSEKGTLLIIKNYSGDCMNFDAAAEQGMSLPEVKAVAEKVIANVRSLGFALTSCTVPAKGSPTFALADDELEFGVGIHGEPGIAREKIPSASVLAERMVGQIVGDVPFAAGDEVAVMVNGLGATPLQELYLLNNAVAACVEAKGLKIHRTFVGNFMTAIDMAGASVTLLRLDAQTKALLDAPADTPALKI